MTVHAKPQPPEPEVLPDVATQPHPVPGAAIPPGPDHALQDVLPEIAEVAQKVGGFKKLSKIADDLDAVGH